MDYLSAVFGRQTKFEPGTITEIDQAGAASVRTAGRTEPRAGLARATPERFGAADRVLMVTGGQHEQPIILGWNPWITE